MTRLTPLLFLLLLAGPLLHAQQPRTVTLRDAATRDPLPGATLRWANGGAVTNARGQAVLPATLASTDTVTLHSEGYQTLRLPASALEAQGGVVALEERQIDLEAVVITSSRWAERQSDVPQSITRIRARDIAFYNPASTPDVLSHTGKVYVQKSQLGGGSPMVRGFSANGLLLVVDGVRLNNAIYRGENLQNSIMIEGPALESVEVLFGPGSSLYGSDALGGVLSFNTQRPYFSANETGLTVAGEGFARWASAANERTGHLSLYVGGRRLASYTSLTVSDFDDLRTGNLRSPYDPAFGRRDWYVERIGGLDSVVRNSDPNVQKFSGYTQYNLLQKLRLRLSPRAELHYGLYYTTSSNIPRYDRLIETRNGLPRNAEWYYGPQRWQMHTLGAELKQGGFFDEARITAAFQDYTESRNDRRFRNNTLRTQLEQVRMLSLNADLKKELREGLELYYGLEGWWNGVTSTATNRNIVSDAVAPTGTRYPDGTNDVYSAAAYASVVYKPTEKLTLTAAGRYTWYTLRSTFVNKSFFPLPFDELRVRTSSPTGGVGVVYNPGHDWRFTANAAVGFRAPNVDDAGKVFDSAPGLVVVPNDGIAPEYVYTVEAGVSKTWEGRFTVSGEVFHSWIDGSVERRPFRYEGQDSIVYDGVNSQVLANVNAGIAYVWGFTLTVSLDLTEHFGLRSVYTWQDGRNRNTGYLVRAVPPSYGRTSLRWAQGRLRAELAADYAAWRTFDQLPPDEQAKVIYSTQGSPAWWTLNLRTSWRLTPHLRLDASLENLLDVHYRPYSSGISAPGRNLLLGLRASF